MPDTCPACNGVLLRRCPSCDAPFSSIAAVGPRGKVVPAPGAAWHLFVCDESGWAATAAMVESLTPGDVALIAARQDKKNNCPAAPTSSAPRTVQVNRQ